MQDVWDEIRKFGIILDFREYRGDYVFVVSSLLGKEDLYYNLSPRLTELGFSTFVMERDGIIYIIARRRRPEKVWLNLLLILITVLTTMMAGAELYGVNYLENPSMLYVGLPFAASIMIVLGTHEIGHYVVARRNNMRTSFPFFIPLPFSIIGTAGAIIVHRDPIPNRKALFDVGISGPLVGLAVAIVVTLIGFSMEPTKLPPEVERMIESGEVAGLSYGILPPLFELLVKVSSMIKGTIIVPEEYPIAFAGWVGMFATFLNLLPAGQLDGGHISRAVLGRYHEYLSRIVPFALFLVGAYYLYVARMGGGIWIFWGLIAFWIANYGHPPPIDDRAGIGKGRILLALFTALLAVGCFTPVPLVIT